MQPQLSRSASAEQHRGYSDHVLNEIQYPAADVIAMIVPAPFRFVDGDGSLIIPIAIECTRSPKFVGSRRRVQATLR